jgi:aminoglycoside phosphotransferase (APT) family kinase protein
VCHHDAGPHNMVFGDDGLPYALIDFDLAAPGDALDDVSYAAWLSCVNSAWLHSARPVEQARRLRLFVDSYGLDAQRRPQLLDAVIARQLDGVCWADRCLADRDLRRSVREHATRMLAGCKRERTFVLANREMFERALR